MDFARQCLASGERISLTSSAPAFWLSLESYCVDTLRQSTAALRPRANTDSRWRTVILPMIERGELSEEAAMVMRSKAARETRVPGLYWPCLVSVMLADVLGMPSSLAYHVQRYARELDYLRAVQWTRRILTEAFPPESQPDEFMPVHDDDEESDREPESASVTLQHRGRVIVEAQPFTRPYWRQLARHCYGMATDSRSPNRDAVPALYLSYAAGVALWSAGLSHGHIARAMPADRSRWSLRYELHDAQPMPLAPQFSPMARGQVSRAIRSTATRLAALGGIRNADAA